MKRVLCLVQKALSLLLLVCMLYIASAPTTIVVRFVLRKACGSLWDNLVVMGLASSMVYRYAADIACSASSCRVLAISLVSFYTLTNDFAICVYGVVGCDVCGAC